MTQLDTVILCGGLGTRLRATIGDSQKVMADVGGHPFLDLLIGNLKKQGLNQIILCAGFKSETLQERYGSKVKKVICETEPLGTGGAIGNAASVVQSDQFFVLNGDCYCEISYEELFKFHRRNQALGTLTVTKVKDNRDYGTIEIDDRNRIVKFLEKGALIPDSLVNVGIYCLNQEIFEAPSMTAKKKFSIEHDVFPEIIKENKVCAYQVKKEFIDIGTPERYERAQQFLAKKFS